MENPTSQDPYQYATVRDGMVYLKPYLNFPERKIGEVKESNESSLKYFSERFELARKKVEDLVLAIENAENKGSHLMKLIHLKEYLANFDAIGNYIQLYDMLNREEAILNELIVVNKKKNLEIKKDLINQAEALINKKDWKNNSDDFKEIRTQWIKTGRVDKDNEAEIEGRFKELVDSFFDLRKQYYDEKNRYLDQKTDKMEVLLKETEILCNTSPSPEGIKRIKEIQQIWKAFGNVPSRKAKPLNQTFKLITKNFFENLKNRPGYKKKEVVSATKAWEDLCEQAEALAGKISNETLKQIKIIQTDWQALGPIKIKTALGLVNRFKDAVARIYEEDFINKTALRRFGLFFNKPEQDQLKLKMGLINELINKGLAELENFENNYQKVTITEEQKDFDKVFNAKLYAQKRKIDVMRKIYEEYKTRLNSLV